MAADSILSISHLWSTIYDRTVLRKRRGELYRVHLEGTYGLEDMNDTHFTHLIQTRRFSGIYQVIRGFVCSPEPATGNSISNPAQTQSNMKPLLFSKTKTPSSHPSETLSYPSPNDSHIQYLCILRSIYNH
jgi:hypothetical protein